jgi:hypothetical protein
VLGELGLEAIRLQQCWDEPVRAVHARIVTRSFPRVNRHPLMASDGPDRVML